MASKMASQGPGLRRQQRKAGPWVRVQTWAVLGAVGVTGRRPVHSAWCVGARSNSISWGYLGGGAEAEEV